MIQFSNISNIDGNTTFVIRHSSREHIPNGVDHTKVFLNGEGIRLAQEFGASLRGRTQRLKFLSSPIGRCVQTCQCIAQGFGTEFPITESHVLGDPGPFVVDRKVGGTLFGVCGTKKAVELIETGIHIEGIHTMAEASEMLMGLVRQETCDNCTTIMVSHDACVAPIICHYTGERFCSDHWLYFMDGFAVQKDAQGMFHLYRNN